MIDCGIYRDGHRIASPRDLPAAVDELHRTEGAFCWVDLHEPNRTELEDVAHAFGLHPLAVKEAFRAHQRPKLETHDDVLLVVVKTLVWKPTAAAVRVGEINVFVGARFVVTVRHGPGIDLDQVRTDLGHYTRMAGQGPAAVLYAICDRVVDGYADIADDLDASVDDVEQSVFSDERTRDAEAVYRLKRHIVSYRRAVRPLAGAMDRLAGGLVDGVPTESAPYFRSIGDRLLRLSEQVEGLDDLLTSILSAHLAQVGVQQNDDMRRISAWVAIAAVPTLLAGIYGMNFDHMPELHWTYGYPGVLVLMAVICTLLYRRLKRAGWL